MPAQLRIVLGDVEHAPANQYRSFSSNDEPIEYDSAFPAVEAVGEQTSWFALHDRKHFR